MGDEETGVGWWNRGIYDEPRGSTLSWITLGGAILYSVIAPLFYPFTAIFVPFVLLFAIAEVLPRRTRRFAVGFRIVGFIYLLFTPILLFSFDLL